tara:strand:+ start:3793 stop:4242 length:450 start_codon:yes stop_codon:yes gene_type:complete
VILGAALLLGAGFTAGYLIRGQFDGALVLTQPEATQGDGVLDYAALSTDFYNDKATQDQAAIIEEYGDEYSVAITAISTSNPQYWESNDIDRAFFAVGYADVVGDYSQVQQLYYQLLAAEQSGKNIYDNSAGVTKEELGDMMGKASLSE